MTTTDFFNQFDDQGLFRQGNGTIDVAFATRGGGRFPGKLHFENGLCVKAGMEIGGDWARDDGSPLHGVKFLLDSNDKGAFGIAIENGRMVRIDGIGSRSSKKEFLNNFRIARNLFVHSRPTADNPLPALRDVGASKTRSAVWLTPKSVAGFDASDFGELGLTRQNELLSAYQNFVTVAREVATNQQATDEQVGNASVAFSQMLSILTPYLAQPEEAEQVGRAVRSVEFPLWVANWDYELGSDEEGNPAVWVDLFAEEGAPSREFGRAASQLIPKIRQRLNETGVNRWPYLRIRTVAEHKAG
jgi:hypothetical protein